MKTHFVLLKFEPKKSLLRSGVRNLILTSGTLSPIDEYTQNLGLKSFEGRPPVELINEHVVSPDQVFATCVTKGINGTELKNVFSNRENTAMYTGMGATVAKLKTVSPGGMLIFPSAFFS